MTEPLTGSLKIPVVTVLPRQFTARGNPTLTEMSFTVVYLQKRSYGRCANGLPHGLQRRRQVERGRKAGHAPLMMPIIHLGAAAVPDPLTFLARKLLMYVAIKSPSSSSAKCPVSSRWNSRLFKSRLWGSAPSAGKMKSFLPHTINVGG